MPSRADAVDVSVTSSLVRSLHGMRKEAHREDGVSLPRLRERAAIDTAGGVRLLRFRRRKGRRRGVLLLNTAAYWRRTTDE